MEKVKWGVLGTADIARGQTIPAMKQAENCDLCAIAGRSLEKAQSFREAFGFAGTPVRFIIRERGEEAKP